MIRTRGLHRALGIVIGRTLGTQVSCDAKEAPQRRRPITSTRGQRAAVIIAEDVEHVNNPTNEPNTDDVRVDAQGFPGEPHDTSILIDYVYHVIATIWECLELKLSSYGRKVQKFGRPTPD
ncbi:hypothetical protein HKD37_16G044807 [Glycine soja]